MATTVTAGAVRPDRDGLFVVLEGGEGAGKTSVACGLRTRLAGVGRTVVTTREPGGTALAEQVRGLLLDAAADGDDPGPRAEALLFAAARADHVDKVVVPALQRGDVVICDRFVVSSIVYQGIGRCLGADRVADLSAFACAGVRPDVTVLLDVPADVGVARAAGVAAADRIEGAGLEFHRTVNAAYRRVVGRMASGAVVDATAPPDVVLDRVWEHLVPLVS